jgi:hypothetical protein
MSVYKIHIRRSDRQRATLQYVTLDGIRIGLRHQRSVLEARWYQWLVTTAGVEFLGPIKLVPGIDLWAPYHYDPRVPPGQLFVHGDPPDGDNTDVSTHLLYREAE